MTQSDQSSSFPAEIAEETNFTMVCKLCLEQLSLEVQAKPRGKACQNVNHDKVREFCKQCFDSNQIVLPLLLPSTATCRQVWR